MAYQEHQQHHKTTLPIPRTTAPIFPSNQLVFTDLLYVRLCLQDTTFAASFTGQMTFLLQENIIIISGGAKNVPNIRTRYAAEQPK